MPPPIEDVPAVRVVEEEEPSAEDVEDEDDDAEDDEPEDDVDVEGALELDEPGEPVLLLFVAPALELSEVLTTVVAGPVPAAGGAAAVTAGPPAPPPPLPPLEDRAAPTFGAGMFCPGGSQSADVLDGSGIRLPFRRDRLTYDRDDVKEALGIFFCSLLTPLGHKIQPLYIFSTFLLSAPQQQRVPSDFVGLSFSETALSVMHSACVRNTESAKVALLRVDDRCSFSYNSSNVAIKVRCSIFLWGYPWAPVVPR